MKTVKLSAVITSIRAKVDRSIAFTVNSPELTPEEKALFFQLQNQNIELTIVPSDEPNVEEYTVTSDLSEKSPSRRLRGVLYVLFTKDDKGMLNFEEYYKIRMEKIIEHLKNQIDV